MFITNVTDKYGDVFYYNDYQDLSDPARFIEFTEEVTARSFYTSDIEIQPGDRFLTLSTCSYEYGPRSRDADVRTAGLPGLCRALAAGVAVCLRLHKCGLRTLADTFDVFGPASPTIRAGSRPRRMRTASLLPAMRRM